MRIAWRYVLIAGLALSVSGCTTFDIEGDSYNTPPDKPHGQATHHGSYWGFDWGTWTADKECGEDVGLFRVRYHTNVLYTLGSVCSLGLWVPQDVEWWCKPAKASGPEEPGTTTPTFGGSGGSGSADKEEKK